MYARGCRWCIWVGLGQKQYEFLIWKVTQYIFGTVHKLKVPVLCMVLSIFYRYVTPSNLPSRETFSRNYPIVTPWILITCSIIQNLPYCDPLGSTVNVQLFKIYPPVTPWNLPSRAALLWIYRTVTPFDPPSRVTVFRIYPTVTPSNLPSRAALLRIYRTVTPFE